MKRVHVLSDYKVTSVYSFGKDKPDWTAQCNLLAALARRNQMPVDRLQIVAIWRDWRPREAQYDPDYPQAQVSVIPIPLWSEAEAEAYLHERVRLHQLDTPPPCTDEERWAQPQVWALMKKGKKRAIKLFGTESELMRHAEKNGCTDLVADGPYYAPKGDWTWKFVDGYYSEHRPGAYRRCENYCAASDVCPQLKLEAA